MSLSTAEIVCVPVLDPRTRVDVITQPVGASVLVLSDPRTRVEDLAILDEHGED